MVTIDGCEREGGREGEREEGRERQGRKEIERRREREGKKRGRGAEGLECLKHGRLDEMIKRTPSC